MTFYLCFFFISITFAVSHFLNNVFSRFFTNSVPLRTTQTSDVEPKQTQRNAKLTNPGHNEVDISKIPIINQLLLKGIPFAQNEDLQSIFTSVAKEIDYFLLIPSRYPKLQRQTIIKNGIESPTNTIIMYFTDHRSKQRFHSQFVQNCPNTKTFLTALNTNQILIGENLTKENDAIFSECLKYKKNKKIATTFSDDGIVYIKFKKGGNEPKYPITSKMDLDHCIKTNGLNQDGIDGTKTANRMQRR